MRQLSVGPGQPGGPTVITESHTWALESPREEAVGLYVTQETLMGTQRQARNCQRPGGYDETCIFNTMGPWAALWEPHFEPRLWASVHMALTG